MNQCRALKFLWPNPTSGKFTPWWKRTKVVTSHKPDFQSCLLLSHTFKRRAGPFCTQLPQFDLLCVYALSFASLFPCPQPQSILCHPIWNAWKINIPFSRSRVRAPGLQWHRRTTLHFSDWPWLLLWGDGASLCLPVCLFPASTHRAQLGHGSLVPIPGSSCTASRPSPGEAAGAARPGTARLTDTVWHLASAPCSSQLFPQALQVWLRAWSCGAHSVWERGCDSGAAVLEWVMQCWCGVMLWGLCFGSREGGRAGKGGSAKVTTETWYSWILAILTYFWLLTHCWWQKRSKMEGLKLWEKKKESFHNFLGSRLFMIIFS